MPDGPTRPAFHFTARAGWINDPYGLSFHDGTYHLFFQYVPGGTTWRLGCHWGHATSPDLVTWTEEDVALAPGEGDDGIWSGSVVRDGDDAHSFYTSVSEPNIALGRVRRAVPVDGKWLVWEKRDLVVEAPSELSLLAFRDPFVFRDGAGWRMLVGAALEGGTAAAASFSSPDLLSWTYDGIAAQRSSAEIEPVWTGTLWECPQIFEIDGRHVVVTSVWEDDILHYAAYGVGSYADGIFTAQTWGQVTYGPSYYAPSFFRDTEGEPNLVFWMRGAVDAEAGWAGALSVPHRLHLVGDRLVTSPHPDLLAYARPKQVSDLHELDSAAAHLIEWPADAGDLLEIARDGRSWLTLRRTSSGLTVRVGAAEPTAVPTEGTVTILLDGPCAEIWTGAAAFGLGTSAQGSGTLVVAGGATAVSALRR